MATRKPQSAAVAPFTQCGATLRRVDMKIFNLLIGIMNILMFVFILFPDSLKVALKMDPYRLLVFFILGICLIYWIFLLARYLINRRNPLKKARKPLRLIKDFGTDNYYFIIEGNICCHIPDLSTLNYLGSYFEFSLMDSVTLLPSERKRKFIKGEQIPSILTYCSKTQLQ
jgi:hypothetical protein